MPQVTAQIWAESKSLLKAWHISSLLFPRENTVESSAKIDGFPTRLVGKSLIGRLREHTKRDEYESDRSHS